MKNLLQKDKKNRKIVKTFEHKRLMLKVMINNSNFSKILRWNFYEKLSDLPVKSSLFQLNNRCVLTGRKKRINKIYSFSRIMFLRLVRSSSINGVKKSAW